MEIKARVRYLRKDFAGSYAAASKALVEVKDWPPGATWQNMREDLMLGLPDLGVRKRPATGQESGSRGDGPGPARLASGGEQACGPEG